MPYIRKYKNEKTGRTEVQVLYKERGKVIKTVQIGMAKNDRELKAFLHQAQAIIDDGKVPFFDLDQYNA